jgi:hypothetical protein
MKQEVRTIGEVPTAPPPAPKPAPEPPATSARRRVRNSNSSAARPPIALPESTVPKEVRKPPPPLFECKTWESEVYLSDTATPEGSMRAPEHGGPEWQSESFGAGEACEVKRDVCTALDRQALCSGWRGASTRRSSA